jgi:hypothetical protein
MGEEFPPAVGEILCFHEAQCFTTVFTKVRREIIFRVGFKDRDVCLGASTKQK